MTWKPALVALAIASGVLATPMPQISNSGPTNGGTGPYAPATYITDSSISGHTIYMPKTIPTDLKLPVLVWGNGGCFANGIQFLSLLNQISSHGVFVIASGTPNGRGTTTAAMMTQAIDWVTSDTVRNKYSFLDTSRIGVAGQSCGGVEAYGVEGDKRLSVIGIFNSGLMSAAESQRIAPTITKPIFYFLGGSSDIAYANGERDYDLLPAGTPSWKGNLAVGHLGTYTDIEAGRFGVAAARFFQWTLRGNATAAAFFTGQEAKEAGWTVESKNLDAIEVTPI